MPFPQLQGFLAQRRQKQQQFPQYSQMKPMLAAGVGNGVQPSAFQQGQQYNQQAGQPNAQSRPMLGGKLRQAAYNQATSDMNRQPAGGKWNRRRF